MGNDSVIIQNFLMQLIKFFRRENLYQTKIIVACSGGPDSLALLDAMTQIQKQGGFTVVAAHFEHGLRGEASMEDAEFVAQTAARLSIPFYLERGDTPGWARQRHISVETAARELRYNFLRSTRKKIGADFIATAHHADDQAETLLMRLLRGTGAAGLGGIRERRGDLIRPFLNFAREEILTYIKARRLTPRHDVTNDLPDCLRNKVRLELMPKLRRDYNPRLTTALTQLAELAAADSDFISDRAKNLLKKKGGVLTREWFARQHIAMQRALLREHAKMIVSDTDGWNFAHIEGLRCLLLMGNTGSTVCLPGGWRGEVSYGCLSLVHFDSAPGVTGYDKPCFLNIPGVTATPWGRFDVAKVERTSETPSAFTVYFDTDTITQPLTVRQRQMGDVMRVSGGCKSLKKIFQERKIPAAKRREVPVVVAADGNIIWLPGIRRSSLSYINNDTVSVIAVTFTPKF